MAGAMLEAGLPSMRQVARHALLRHLKQTPVGSRLPSLDELSRDYQIGRNNMQEAMRELAKEGMVVSRPRLGTFVLRQQPEESASDRPILPTATSTGLSLSATARLAGKRVAMLAHDVDEPMVRQLAATTGGRLSQLGAQVNLQAFDLKDGPQVLPGDADLILFFNPSLGTLKTWRNPIPLVATSTVWHGGCTAGVPFDLVGVDQVQGAMLAGTAMRQAGHQEVCYLRLAARPEGGSQESTSDIRLRGFEAGFDKSVRAEHQIEGVGFSLKGGSTCLAQYLRMEHRPQAIFAASDELAVGFIVAAQAHDLQPGRDFHIIGFDGQRMGRQLHDGPLSTVDLPLQAMGEKAGQLVVARLLQPELPSQVTYLGCQFFEGSTFHAAHAGPSHGDVAP